MPDTSSPPPRRFSGARIAATIAGSVLALLAVAGLLGGAALLWANGHKDHDGYVSTHTERFSTRTAALATENLDVNLDGADSVLSPGEYGKVRVRVTPRAGKDVFVGIARTADVTAYLRGTTHETVTDVDYSPFHASYRTVEGASAVAAPPAARAIWAASAHGTGPQTLTWDVADGNWTVVVMNADGTPGVDARVKAGADLPWLDDAAWIVLGTGVVLALAAAGLLFAGLRTPRPPAAPSAGPSDDTVPAAA
jgi:hypothetical protein